MNGHRGINKNIGRTVWHAQANLAYLCAVIQQFGTINGSDLSHAVHIKKILLSGDSRDAECQTVAGLRPGFRKNVEALTGRTEERQFRGVADREIVQESNGDEISSGTQRHLGHDVLVVGVCFDMNWDKVMPSHHATHAGTSAYRGREIDSAGFVCAGRIRRCFSIGAKRDGVESVLI